MAEPAGSIDLNAEAPPARDFDKERFRLFLFGGALLLLVYFTDPANGLINIPVSFFLKNRLHLQAHDLAIFRLWIAIPLFCSFIFGFLRDQWSPFGLGDQGHIIVFGCLTAVIYVVIAQLPPTYMVLLLGMLVATTVFQIVGSAAAGLVATIGQERDMAGQMSSLLNFAVIVPVVAGSLLGGVLSGALEGASAQDAAKVLFYVAAGLMVLVALIGLARPRAIFGERQKGKPPGKILEDVGRLLTHWPIIPVLIAQALWQFSPATGVVLQYHIANALHASDAQWGLWNAIFFGSFIPMFILYGYLCQRFTLSKLLWWGFIVAVFQMTPLLFVHTATGALIAAAPMGMIGGIAQAALTDLAIRSCPKNLQGTMMMLFGISIYWAAGRFGDLFGTELYDHFGGFTTAVVATIIVYALILPVLLLVPKRLIATSDGEALEVS